MSEKTPQHAVHIIVHGFVQGVGFRYFTLRVAERLGITGWVRNRHDGTVEILAEGSENQLNQLAKWVEQGPEHALVESLDLHWLSPKGEHNKFHVQYL